MKHTTRYITLAVVLAVASAVWCSAQSVVPRVRATIEPDTVMIGDRAVLTIEVEKDKVQTIVFPQYVAPQSKRDSLPPIELVRELPTDTVQIAARREVLRKRFEVAVFDEGIYALGRPQVLYADKNIIDTLRADDSLHLVVTTFAIDSTSHAIFDLKPQKTLRFRFGEVSGYLSVAVAVALLLVLVVWLAVRYLHRRGRHISDLFRPAPPVPAHIVAIEALEQLHDQKLWQAGKHKQYYSSLSDILRTYLDGRYGVGAMEMTTDEIVEALRPLDLPQKSAFDLVAVLRDADLVKFAKATPEASDNESCYHKAYYFVEETKPVEETPDDDEPTPNREEGKL